MYTLADLTRMTGAKRRSVQLWAEAGALFAMPGTSREGSGKHRVFVRREAIIACILNGLAAHGAPIGRLLTVATLLRDGLEQPFMAEIVEDALANRGRNFLFITVLKSAAAEDDFNDAKRALPPEVGAKLAILLQNPVQIHTWSSSRSKDSLDEALTNRLEGRRSVVAVNVNACFAGALELARG